MLFNIIYDNKLTRNTIKTKLSNQKIDSHVILSCYFTKNIKLGCYTFVDYLTLNFTYLRNYIIVF